MRFCQNITAPPAISGVKPLGHPSPHLAGINFENDWVIIRSCNMVIKAGHAWDGCSPCVSILGLYYVGTPDGAEHLGVPATYHASLVHDALCQRRREIPISKGASVAVFRDLLLDARFPLAGLYAAAVARFGPRDFHSAGLGNASAEAGGNRLGE